jgi:DEAD/DEAH box helicase domain-containing protein
MDIPQIASLVFDVEIQRSPDEVGGWGNKAVMGVAVCSIYDLSTNLIWHFDEHSLSALQKVLTEATLRVSFNGEEFDRVVLQGSQVVYPQDPNVDYDIRQEFIAAKKDRFAKGSLDAICQACFGVGKTAHGEEAPRMYKEGRLATLHTYCGHDTALTAQLFRYIQLNGYVVDPQTGQMVVLRKPPSNYTSQRQRVIEFLRELAGDVSTSDNNRKRAEELVQLLLRGKSA